MIKRVDPEIMKKTSENKSRWMFAVAKLTSIKMLVTNRRAKNVLVVFMWFVLKFEVMTGVNVFE